MKPVISCLLVSSFLFIILTSYSQAEPRSYIRFYKANKLLQVDRIMFARKKGMLAGCHNFLKSVPIYRINQTGFKQCQVFKEKDCSNDSLLTIQDEDNAKSQLITQGASWYPNGKDERGKKVKSWKCEK